MPYVLYNQPGNTYETQFGTLKGGVAIPITRKIANELKRHRELIVFEKIAGVDFTSVQKKYYGTVLQEPTEEIKEFSYFVKKNKGNMAAASREYQQYKVEKGLP